MDFSDLGNLGDLAKQMQDAYSEGMAAMNQAGQAAAEDMNPDHEVVVDVNLSAQIEGHDYLVDATITFAIELEPILQSANSPMSDLSSLLDGLGVDLGDDKDAVMEQLGQPKAVGAVKTIELRKLALSNDEGKVETSLNQDGTLLATIKDGKMLVNFESVLSYPHHPGVFIAIPSMEQMQKNIQVDLANLGSKTNFSWIEKDKDGLKVSGNIQFSKL